MGGGPERLTAWRRDTSSFLTRDVASLPAHIEITASTVRGLRATQWIRRVRVGVVSEDVPVVLVPGTDGAFDELGIGEAFDVFCASDGFEELGRGEGFDAAGSTDALGAAWFELDKEDTLGCAGEALDADDFEEDMAKLEAWGALRAAAASFFLPLPV